MYSKKIRNKNGEKDALMNIKFVNKISESPINSILFSEIK